MSIRSADEELAQVKALLDERVEGEGSEEMSTYERVLDVIEAYESWSDLAIRRLHEIHRLTGRECNFCAKWPGSHATLAGVGDRIVLRLTAGGLANNYVSLAGHLEFFPESAIGAADEQNGSGSLVTLRFAGLAEAVPTDIAGGHRFFRRRGPWGRFFAHHHLAEGDQIVIERLSESEYRVTPLLWSAPR